MATQLQAARIGITTDQVRFVAGRENLDAELVRGELAAGRLVGIRDFYDMIFIFSRGAP